LAGPDTGWRSRFLSSTVSFVKSRRTLLLTASDTAPKLECASSLPGLDSNLLRGTRLLLGTRPQALRTQLCIGRCPSFVISADLLPHKIVWDDAGTARCPGGGDSDGRTAKSAGSGPSAGGRPFALFLRRAGCNLVTTSRTFALALTLFAPRAIPRPSLFERFGPSSGPHGRWRGSL